MHLSVGCLKVLCLLLLNVKVRGQVPGPNAVVAINGQTMLDCLVSIIELAASTWRHSPNGTSNFSAIATGCNNVTGNNAAYYKTELLGGNICRLTIANVTMQQGGVYVCYDGGLANYLSLVTVIDPFASLVATMVNKQSEVVEGDQLNISCSINYNGPASPAPSLRPSPYWTTSSGQIFTSAIYHPSTNIATVVATVTAQKPTVPVFQCKTVFEITGSSFNYNSTAPADNFTVGNTTELMVQYNASTPAIIKSYDGECGTISLTCKSSGHPSPRYKWYHWNETVSVFLTEQPILKSVEANATYICEAYNTIRNVKCSSSTNYNVSESDFNSPCSTTSPGTTHLSIGLNTTIGLAAGLGGYGLLNIIATIVFLWFYNRRSKTVTDGREIYTFRNKARLNGRCPWLRSMLPCLNESRGNAGCSFLWVLLFILMSILTGIIVFPILVAVANCSQERNDAKEDPDIGISNVYQENTIDRNAAAKSCTDAHGHAEAPYDEIGTMHPGRKGAIEEPTSSKNKDARKVFYTKVNPHFNTEESVERYSVSS